MVNFGLLAAEIGSLVWGIPANVNRFRVLAALLHGTLLYWEVRPSRWALAHIYSSSSFFLLLLSFFFFPRLISAAGDWMSTILLHMVWP